jgi:hypothetical protein
LKTPAKKFQTARNTELTTLNQRAKSQLRRPTDSWVENPYSLQETQARPIGATGRTSASNSQLREEATSTAPTNYSSKKAKKIVHNSEIKQAY